MSEIELLSPAGSFETARSAFEAGADAVYLGLDAFSARADAVNFTSDQLRDLLALAHRAPSPRRVYVTFNTLLDDAQIPDALERLALLADLRPDGLIVQDLGIARLVRTHFPSLELHASTQLVCHNLEGALALRELGFTRIVLARELSLEEIQLVSSRCGCEIEVFVHGALCYSLSGLCLFSALEKNRSGNRGKCAYCCRLSYTDAAGNRGLPFSMRDLRLDGHLERLRAAGVASLKIEGRMKSPLYVASVTSHYRQLLDGRPVTTTQADLETVFSRRTTSLYLDGAPRPAAHAADASRAVIDPSSLGHLGTPVGTVKRIAKDREGRAWIRFHTTRALERHDGLQFLSPGGKPYGFGISDMRLALARSTVFAAPAKSDVEILLPPVPVPPDAILPGATVFCSASNEVKRRFPIPPFRPADVVGEAALDLTVTLAPDAVTVLGRSGDLACSLSQPGPLSAAQHPERTEEAVRHAFARLGGTAWHLASFTLVDPEHLFAPASLLNELRRRLVEKLDADRLAARAEKVALCLSEQDTPESVRPLAAASSIPSRVLKMRLDQPLPDDACEYDELVVAMGHGSGKEIESALTSLAADLRALAEGSGDPAPRLRLALPVFTHEPSFNALRSAVKHMAAAGISAWEAADLAGLRLLRQLGLDDLTADWTLYAFNRPALRQLSELGVLRCVCSPENTPENLAALAAFAPACGLAPEFLATQSTPLFISLTRPATEDPSLLTGLRGDSFMSYPVDGLWITSRVDPRRFTPPQSAPTLRTDISWDPV